MLFCEKLVRLRKQKGLSQEELGLELGVSRQTVSKWEAGQSYPDFQKLVLLGDYFQLSLDELVRDVDLQAVRNDSQTIQKVDALLQRSEKAEELLRLAWRWLCLFGWAIIGISALALVAGLILRYAKIL